MVGEPNYYQEPGDDLIYCRGIREGIFARTILSGFEARMPDWVPSGIDAWNCGFTRIDL